MEQNFKFVKQYVVTVEEARQKKLVVYAEGESEAAWAALKLVEKGVVTIDAASPVLSCQEVREADPLDKKWYPRYGTEGLK